MTRQFLDLLFEPNETFCVSHNKYGYRSISREDLNGGVCLKGQGERGKDAFITENDINLVALNPIDGPRDDDHVTAFRSFLIELDHDTLAAQKQYIEESGLPYSICVFSGNKSLHYGIVLDKPCLDIHHWRYVNEWILNILDKADQQTKNPSRSIRFPGNMRNNGAKKLQALVDYRGRVSATDLNIWLNQYEDKRPQPVQPTREFDPDFIPSLDNMPEFFYETLENLRNGTQPERNASWFKMAIVMAERNFELDEMLAYLEQFFIEESDFRRREWKTCVKSAYKRSLK